MILRALTSCLFISDVEVSDRLVASVACDADQDDEPSLSCGGTDCDDDDPAVIEPLWYPDVDADTYGDARAGTGSCSRPDGWIADGSDCDDSRFDVNPASPESCNGFDDNCDGAVDEPGARGELAWYADSDGDAHGDPNTTTAACAQPDGFVTTPGDCDDTDPAIFPGATEDCDGLDNDCDTTLDNGAPCSCEVQHLGTHAYQFCSATTDWGTARAACAVDGYTLVTIDDDTENNWVVAYGGSIRAVSVWWIGLNDRATEGTYVWGHRLCCGGELRLRGELSEAHRQVIQGQQQHDSLVAGDRRFRGPAPSRHAGSRVSA